MTSPVGFGDISNAVSYSSLSLGNLIANGTIRPMAKYKPVRHSEVEILSVTQRAGVRYGFATALPQLPMAADEPQNDWVYLRPRGGSSELFRALDFDGYVNDACAPLVVDVQQITNDGLSVVMLYGDGMTNGTRGDGKAWVSDESLSLEELLASVSDYTGYNIAFLVCNGGVKNLVVTKMTAWSFIHERSKVASFYMYPTYTEDSGVKYPQVPVLASSKSGDKVTVIACLASGGPTSSEMAYSVYTDISGRVAYSLGFVSGCDRASAPVTTTAFKMDGVTISALNVTAVAIKDVKDSNGYYWRGYSISVNGTFNMSGAQGWSPTDLAKTLSGSISVSNGGGFFFGSSPDDASKIQPITSNVSVALLPYGNGQGRSVFSTGSDRYLWVLLSKQGGSPITTVRVTAKVTFDTPLTSNVEKEGYCDINA